MNTDQGETPGEEIARRRKALGFTQNRFAKAAGISLGTLRRMEEGVGKTRQYTWTQVFRTLTAEESRAGIGDAPVPHPGMVRLVKLIEAWKAARKDPVQDRIVQAEEVCGYVTALMGLDQ